MNETEFKAKWESEKPVYRAWGRYVLNTISRELERKGRNLDVFLKVPAKYRLKDDKSLIDKAFYRPDKNYSDPYKEIEDKVGVRFIVLLISDIHEIYNLIQENKDWSLTTCKHFESDRKKDPLLFTYQSVHCILRPNKNIVYEDIKIPVFTPCEIQIRTLLQHAHAELTHDAIYKSKKTVRPEIHRTVAKSMALIETTDGFFSEVTDLLNYGPLEEFKIIERLDAVYLIATGFHSYTQKSSVIIWDVFDQFIAENLVDEIQAMVNRNSFLAQTIKEKYSQSVLHQQSTVLFVYWMLRKHKRRLLEHWPFSRKILETLATDFGISIGDD